MSGCKTTNENDKIIKEETKQIIVLPAVPQPSMLEIKPSIDSEGNKYYTDQQMNAVITYFNDRVSSLESYIEKVQNLVDDFNESLE